MSKEPVAIRNGESQTGNATLRHKALDGLIDERECIRECAPTITHRPRLRLTEDRVDGRAFIDDGRPVLGPCSPTAAGG
jgi:hypothetical protein